jgi:hypothetical protein
MENSRKTIEFDEPTQEARANAVDDLTGTIRALGEMLESGVREHMRDRPYAVIGAAFGLGYVLGGGLPKMAVRAATAMGLRYAAFEALRRAGIAPGRD